MDKTIEKYRQRRDARAKRRMDDDWKTIKGTHVLIDDEGQVSGGPENLKNLIKSSGGFKSGTKKPAKSAGKITTKYKSVSEFKKALADRDKAMSEKVSAEEQWKEAKAFRASMYGKTAESLKKDIADAKKSGDSDKLERAKHDLKRYQDRVKKFGEDFGVAAAEKKMNDAEKKHGELDKQIKGFEKEKGFGKKETGRDTDFKRQEKDYFNVLEDDRYVDNWEVLDALEAHTKLLPFGTGISVGNVTFDKVGDNKWTASINTKGETPAGLYMKMRDLADRKLEDYDVADWVYGSYMDSDPGTRAADVVKFSAPKKDRSKAVSVAEYGKKKMKDDLGRVSKRMRASDVETSDDDFRREGYRKNKEGRWERADGFDKKNLQGLQTGNITNDIRGKWGESIKSAPAGTSFSVKSSNRWHDEVETFTKTDTGWRFERTVDGRDADKGNADLGRIWNSLRDGRLFM